MGGTRIDDSQISSTKLDNLVSNVGHILAPVANTSNLPISANDGDQVFVTSENMMYRFDGSLATPAWIPLDANNAQTLGGQNPSYYAVDADVIHKAGDTMTGSLVLNADPTADLEAATKKYVDSNISTVNSSIDTKVSKSGDTMTGALTLPSINLQDQAPISLTNLSSVPATVPASGTTAVVNNQWYISDGTQWQPMSAQISYGSKSTAGIVEIGSGINVDASGVISTNPATVGAVNLTGDTMTGPLILNADPSQSLGAATKQYVDSVATGLQVKDSVRAATTGTSITLSGTQTIDGIALQAGDRVLVKDQTNQAQNGIYIVQTGAWTLAPDANSSANVKPGMFVFVDGGTQNIGSGWVLALDTDTAITIGTTNLTFTQFSGAGEITAGNGLSKSGNTLYLAYTGVTSGTYTQVTVDGTGRVTSASNPTTLSGYGITDAVNTSQLSTSATANAVAQRDTNGNLAGNILGNAATATTLQTARTIGLSGDASGSVSFDGSANETISVTLANSGVTAGTYTQVTVDAKGRVTSATSPTTLSGYGITDAVNSSQVVTTATPNKILELDSNGSLPTSVTGNAATATALQTARTISLTGDATASTTFDGSANESMTVTLANSGVTAGTYTQVTVDAKGRVTSATSPTTLSGYGITDPVALTTGATFTGNVILNADPTQNLGAATKQYVDSNVTTVGTGLTKSGTQVSITDTGVTAGTYTQVTVNAQGQVTSATSPTTLSGYGITDAVNSSMVVTTATANKILELDSNAKLPASITGNADGNAATASKLATAQTISLSGDMSGSVSFDGSQAVTISTTLANSGVTAGTYKSLTVDAKGRVTGGTNPTTLSGYGITDAVNSSMVVTTATANKLLELDASGNLPTSVTGNAATASKLATARTIGLSGDASGSVSFDGSANETISVTLANSGANAGTYTQVTVDSKGRVTSAANPTTLSGYGITDAVNIGGATMTGALILNADPSQALGAATKQYVDATASGLQVKKSAQVATTGSNLAGTYSNGVLTLSTALTTLDGYTIQTNDRILVKDQTTQPQNGIYVYTNSTTLTRSSDANTSSELAYGTFVFVDNGTLNKASGWVMAGSGTFTLDSSNVVFTQFSGAGEITAGTGLTKSGNTLSITNSGVTSGTYTQVTVNAQGQVTSAANPTTLSGYGITDAVNSSQVVTTATANKILELDSNAKLPASITGNADGNAATATKLATARTIGLSGDASGSVSFDGSANETISVTLANSGVTSGTYTQVTVDSKGRVTSATSPTTLSGYGITDAVARKVNVSDVEITSTSATTIATLTPAQQDNFMVSVYYRVLTATTNVQIVVNYNDGSGAQSATLVTGGQAVGSYTIAPILINALPNAPINIQVTAGTANQVYVSAKITE